MAHAQWLLSTHSARRDPVLVVPLYLVMLRHRLQRSGPLRLAWKTTSPSLRIVAHLVPCFCTSRRSSILSASLYGSFFDRDSGGAPPAPEAAGARDAAAATGDDMLLLAAAFFFPAASAAPGAAAALLPRCGIACLGACCLGGAAFLIDATTDTREEGAAGDLPAAVDLRADDTAGDGTAGDFISRITTASDAKERPPPSR